MRHYNVVCAVIVIDGKILCMQRPVGQNPCTSHKWEFPGGKIEEGETPQQALCREMIEEMDYEVTPIRSLMKVNHEYPDFTIALDAWLCQATTMEFNMKEHLEALWLRPSELDKLDWAAADYAVIHAIQQGEIKI